MDRRTLLAAGATLAALPLGETMPGSRVGATDVRALAAAVESLRAVGRSTGGYVPGLAALAERGEELAKLPAQETTRKACLRVATEAWTLAGYTALDAGRRATAWGHFDRALTLADEVGDAAAASQVLRYAGTLETEAGRYNEALRLYQLAGIKLLAARGVSDAPLIGPTAHAYAALGRGDLARKELARAADREMDPYAAANFLWWKSETLARMGRLDDAHEHAAGSLESFPAGSQREAILSEVTIAGLHRRAGEPDAEELIAGCWQRVEGTASMRARERLMRAEGTLSA